MAWPSVVVFLNDHCRLCDRYWNLFHDWNSIWSWYWNLDWYADWYADWNRDWPVNWDWDVLGHWDWVGFRDVNGIRTIDWDGYWYLKKRTCQWLDEQRSMILHCVHKGHIDDVLSSNSR